MASVWLPPTIEEDEEVEVDESDSEDEATSKERERKSTTGKKQASVFNDDFSFPLESGGGEGGWEMGEEVMEWAERKKDLMTTSLDSKILRAIEQRKLKV